MCRCKEKNAPDVVMAFSAQAVQSEDTMPQDVQLNLKSSVPLPQVIVLPAALSRAADVPRRLTLSKRAQTVPAAVASWLAQDRRYAGWLEAVAPTSEAKTTITPNATPDVDTAERWNADMTAAALREYAKRHSVELAAKDNKDAVVAKIREARADFEDVADDAKSDGESGEASDTE